jgi:hypothetical protein
MKRVDWIMEDANVSDVTIDQKLGEQTSIFMGHADDDDNFVRQQIFTEVQSFKAAVAE